jgi:competence protein ComEA
VDVAGHVRRPGVYRLGAGARVHEAIAAAGGARPGADLTVLNRAAPLLDGQQVLVPRAGAGADATAPSGDASGTVSINRADADALDQLPGIGPVTAERIVSEREQSGPFASIDDLDRVPGVGPATIESLRDVATT